MTLYKRSCELRMMEKDDEVTEEHVSLENLLKDLERQTNFDEFLPYNESKKREGLQADDDGVPPSPGSPARDYRASVKINAERKLIIPLKSLPSATEKNSPGSHYFSFKKPSFHEKKSVKINVDKKTTKVEEIYNLQQEGGDFTKKNRKKILPKINKNVSHSINGLLSLL